MELSLVWCGMHRCSEKWRFSIDIVHAPIVVTLRVSALGEHASCGSPRKTSVFSATELDGFGEGRCGAGGGQTSGLLRGGVLTIYST